MLKERFAVPRTMTSLLPKLGNLRVSNLILVYLTGIVSDDYFLSGSFYPLRSSQGMCGFNFGSTQRRTFRNISQ